MINSAPTNKQFNKYINLKHSKYLPLNNIKNKNPITYLIKTQGFKRCRKRSWNGYGSRIMVFFFCFCFWICCFNNPEKSYRSIPF